MLLGDKIREVLLMLSSKYKITTEHSVDGDESDCEILIEIHQDNHVTESEIKDTLKPIEEEGYKFHVCSMVNHIGILVEPKDRDSDIEIDHNLVP